MSTTDSMVAMPPAATRTRRGPNEWIDRLAGSDPGLNRLRSAAQSVLSIALILGAEWLFVDLTKALQVDATATSLSAAQAAEAAAANHEFLVIAMLLGALVGMISSFGVMDATARGQLGTMLFMPFAMIPALALGIAIGAHRTVALVVLAAILALGTYCRRFGPRGFIAGMLLFMGYFIGFFLQEAVSLDQLGWLAAEVGVGLLVAIAVRFTFFYPRSSKALARTQRSYAARARKLAALALELFEAPEWSERGARRLHRQLVRVNEAALMIDAQLAEPGAVIDGSSRQQLHQRLFDLELALTNVARFAEAMTRLQLPADQCSEVRLALLDIVRRDTEGAVLHATNLIALLADAGETTTGEDLAGAGRTTTDEDRSTVVIPHRFAGSVIALAEAMGEWIALGEQDAGGSADFQPSVALFGGWLPGSTQVSATASQERGSRRGERLRLAPYSRTAIQMGIAVGVAIVLGDLLSERRFYWAVIAAFITFMGANNSGEQSRKAIYRVLGTLVGIAVGSILAKAVGADGWASIAVILASLFLGFYLMRINYAFMVVGITVMVSQLYVQLDEFSNSLLLLRLEETAIGAAVAIAVVLLVLPLRTRRVLRVALRDHVEALRALVRRANGRLLDDEAHAAAGLRDDARALDASYQALVATAKPLARNLLGSVDEDSTRIVRVAAASRNYGRNLVADVETTTALDADTRLDIERASATLDSSLQAVVDALSDSASAPVYTRSAALFDRAERRLEESSSMIDGPQLALRDLKLLDGAIGGMAESLGLPITDYDTVPILS